MADETRAGFMLFTVWYFMLCSGAAGLGWVMLGVEPRMAPLRRLCGQLTLGIAAAGVGAAALVRWVLP